MKRIVCSDEYLSWRRKMISNPMFQKMANLCSEHGYRLMSAYEVSPGKFEIIIHSETTDQTEIYYNTRKGEFQLELPVNRSMLNSTEYRNIVTLLKDAADLVDELKQLELSELEKGY